MPYAGRVAVCLLNGSGVQWFGGNYMRCVAFFSESDRSKTSLRGTLKLAGMFASMLTAGAVATTVMAAPDPDTLAFWQRFESVGPDHDQNGLPLTDFYDVPELLSTATPGTLIRADKEPFTGYEGTSTYGPISQLPPGVSAYRLLYHSRSTTGKPVVSSGVILLPAGPVPPGGWPVVAWAHGTVGVARNCAPSAMKDIYYGDTGLYGFVDSNITSPGSRFQKYAVVATDYAGLGTRYPHEYLSRIAHGLDVIHSVRAARAALPGLLSKKWVVVGHSQGGEAALGVAELQTAFRDRYYLGAVAVAPLTYLRDTLKAMVDVYPGTTGYLPMVAYSVSTLFPWVNLEDMLTSTALDRLQQVPLLPTGMDTKAHGCYYTAAAGFADFTNHDQVLRTEAGYGINSPWLWAYSAINEPGRVKAYKPMFVAQGVADEVIPVRITDRAVRKLCRIGDRVYYKKYPYVKNDFYQPHGYSVYQSFDDQMQWIADRFAGRPAPNSCAK